jgi:hypothetical protein
LDHQLFSGLTKKHVKITSTREQIANIRRFILHTFQMMDPFGSNARTWPSTKPHITERKGKKVYQYKEEWLIVDT